MSAPLPLGLTDAELVAVFPSPPRPRSLVPGADLTPAPVLPSAPLSRGELISAMRALPAMQYVLRVEDFLAPVTTLQPLINGVAACCTVTAFGLVFLFNDGTFGTAQIAASLGWTVMFYFGGAVAPFLFPDIRQQIECSSGLFRKTLVDFSAHRLGALARWLQLAASQKGDEGRGAAPGRLGLLTHVEEDQYCSCPGPACAGGTARKASWFALIDSVAGHSLLVLTTVSFCWTTLVTFGTQLWSTCCETLFPNPFLSFLDCRVQHRAMQIALADLFRRIREDGAATGEHEDYAVLHPLLQAVWANPRKELADKWFLLLVAALLVVFVVITVAVGNCILSLQVFTLAWVTGFLLIITVTTACANLRTAAAAALSRWAGQELAVLATVVPVDRADLHRRISDHATLLGVFAAADDAARAKYLGFAVDFGVVRAMLVTMLTVLVALWSVLRGSGVFFTMDSVCPLR